MDLSGVLSIAYAVVVLAARVITGSTPSHWCLRLLAVLLGVVVSWGPLPTPGRKERLTFATVTFALATIAVWFTAERLAEFVLSAMLIGAGVRGLVTGRIFTTTRAGPAREHRGPSALFWSAVTLVFGLFWLARHL